MRSIFSSSPSMFLLSQIIPFYVVSSLPNWSSYSYFYCLFPFKLYAIIKYLTTYSDVELQFSDSAGVFITLIKVLCTFAFLFQVEELLSTFLCKAVLVIMNSLRFCLSGKAFFFPSFISER